MLSICRGFSYTMMCLIVIVAPNPLFASDDMNGLSRQDTLPAEDPSWSYSQGPGRLPPRNEPLLFIPNHTAHDNASCLKYFSKDHLLPGAISEGNICIETLKTSSTNLTNPDDSDKHAVLNFHHVCSPLV